MGILYIVATPIGNLEDISVRAIKTLLSVPVIACEDTRHTGQLLATLREEYGEWGQPEKPRYISVRDFNEAKMVDRIMEELKDNDIALVSDAGTPLLSDPGFKIVRSAREAGFSVVPLPGPFAGAVAASAAGLPTNKIMFWGFLPKKWELIPGATNIIYEAPTRIRDTIKMLREKYPEAQIVIARELTKIHEQFVTDEELLKMPENMKGEMTILIYLEH